MNDTQTPKERVLDLFGKNMADHFDLVTGFEEEEQPGILDILFTQINGWIGFFRGDDDNQLYLQDGESEKMVELIKEPEVLKSCLNQFRDDFDEAAENDRVVADFVKKYARDSDEDRLRKSIQEITGVNLWDGESIFDLEYDEE